MKEYPFSNPNGSRENLWWKTVKFSIGNVWIQKYHLPSDGSKLERKRWKRSTKRINMIRILLGTFLTLCENKWFYIIRYGRQFVYLISVFLLMSPISNDLYFWVVAFFSTRITVWCYNKWFTFQQELFLEKGKFILQTTLSVVCKSGKK